jgi:hypothetical protein
VELIWQGKDETNASSIFMTGDGRVLLQGRSVSAEERERLDLPRDGEMVSVDRVLIEAIKAML